tara:strand:- start:164 stop:514 length:351 start_codon:yes stop_codon:yes gene_type:complete
MKLITKEIQKKLDDNLKIDASKRMPYLKLFNPSGAATWLITEHDTETGKMFGLCDLGLGFVEYGYVDMQEIKAIKVPPFGLSIERDTYFEPKMPLSEYAKLTEAQGMGKQSILEVM